MQPAAKVKGKGKGKGTGKGTGKGKGFYPTTPADVLRDILSHYPPDDEY